MEYQQNCCVEFPHCFLEKKSLTFYLFVLLSLVVGIEVTALIYADEAKPPGRVAYSVGI